MRFSGDVATYLTIVDDARYWSGTNSVSYPISDLTRNANLGLDKVSILILKADARWQWDDLNNSDLPIGTTSLVSGRSDYGIAAAHLRVLRVRIRDAQGNFITLNPTDRRNLSDSRLTESDGTPREYDKLANSLVLHPATNYNYTAGLEVQVQRGADPFISTDTTKEPGFASPFHRLVSLLAALDYCEVNGLEVRAKRIRGRIGINDFGQVVGGLAQELIDFYSSRDRDEKQGLRLAKTDYGQRSLAGFRRYGNNPDKFIL